MVLRLWTEPGAGMRVRATSTTDAESGALTTSYASSSAGVLDLVAQWLDELQRPVPKAEGG